MNLVEAGVMFIPLLLFFQRFWCQRWKHPGWSWWINLRRKRRSRAAPCSRSWRLSACCWACPSLQPASPCSTSSVGLRRRWVARLERLETAPVGMILQNSSLHVDFQLKEVISRVPSSHVGDPLMKKPLGPVHLVILLKHFRMVAEVNNNTELHFSFFVILQEKIEAINQALINDYDVRRKMLLKRLDVTVQSFGWSDRAKVPSNLFSLCSNHLVHFLIILFTLIFEASCLHGAAAASLWTRFSPESRLSS